MIPPMINLASLSIPLYFLTQKDVKGKTLLSLIVLVSIRKENAGAKWLRSGPRHVIAASLVRIQLGA